jgi:hypothetical protein
MRKIFLAVLLLIVPALGETFHVTSVRNLQPTDPHVITDHHSDGSRGLFGMRVLVITGTMGSHKYTTQQLYMRVGGQRLETGHDYEVKKVSGDTIEVLVPDKKGRPNTERLRITEETERNQ